MVFDDQPSHLGARPGDRLTPTWRTEAKSLSSFACRRCAIRLVAARRHRALLSMAKNYKSGTIYDKIWKRLIEPEKKNYPEKKGVRRAHQGGAGGNLSGTPLAI